MAQTSAAATRPTWLDAKVQSLRAARALAGVRWLGQRRPVVVSWAITHRCNLRCVYCDVPDHKLPELSTAQALALVEDMGALGTCAVSINGGEAMLRPDIEVIARRIRELGMALSITTNGTYLPRRLGVLDHLYRLQLSVDGPREIHERQRGVGTWESVTNAVAAVRKHGTRLLLSVVLTRHNLHYIDAILDLAHEWGAKVNFLPVSPVHAFDIDHEKHSPTPEAMRAAFAYIADRARRGAPILGSQSAFDYLKSWPLGGRIPCFAGSGLVKIAADGNVFPCAMLEHKTKGISAVEHGLRGAVEFLRDDPLECVGCHCTKTLQLNQLYFDTLAAIPFSVRNLVERWVPRPATPAPPAPADGTKIERVWRTGSGPGGTMQALGTSHRSAQSS